MTNRPQLVGPDGRPVTPSDLAFRVAKVGPELLAATRRQAERHGRVIEVGDTAVFALGVVARLVLPAGLGAPGAASEAARLLAGLGASNADDGALVRPLALGALPFDPRREAALVVPRILVRSDPVGGDEAIVAGEEVDLERLVEPDDAASEPAPDEFTVTSARPPAEHCAKVAAAVAAIGAGAFDKVVLARELFVDANRPFRQADLIERLRRRYPTCAVFAIDGFVGASPELLCSRRGDTVVTRPLAGTVARGASEQDDAEGAAALFASDKERAEHRLVVDEVATVLRRHALRLEVPSEPGLVSLANVLHLGTEIRATLAAPAPTALELVAELHPTPAIGGAPRGAALDYLLANEGFDRRRYGGPVGWVDAAGDGDFWIGIRSADVEGKRARLVAGGGIVAGSDPQAELAETTAKFDALLAALTAAADDDPKDDTQT